jgi:hypothetical protein
MISQNNERRIIEQWLSLLVKNTFLQIVDWMFGQVDDFAAVLIGLSSGHLRSNYE